MTDANATGEATTKQPVSSGVDALIRRLKQEGADEGRAEAQKLIADAETRARNILAQAEATAKSRTDTAAQEADRTKRAGEEALKLAMRDAVLELKDGLSSRFARQVEGVVAKLSSDEELLKHMILAVASRARSEAGIDNAKELEIILPRTVVGLDELRRNPQELREGALGRFALASAADMLRAGVTFARSGDDRGGIRIVLKEGGIQVDLTDVAVADVILRHLQPRFRALLEGVVS
jgi:V/A-type H+-transporting ATPase subunit E